MSTGDITRLAKRLSLRTEEVCRTLLPEGRKEGRTWRCGDVTGSKGDSMTVELLGAKAGQWFDHAAGQGGDLLQLVMANRAMTTIQAADWARSFLGEPKWQPNGDHRPTWDPLKQAKWLCRSTNEWLLPTKAWAYHDAAGAVIAFACRYEWTKPDGTVTKDVIPFRPPPDGYLTMGGKQLPPGTFIARGWPKDSDEPPPLYNLHLIAGADRIIVTEGEKKADMVPSLFKGWIGVSWQGGCKAVQRVDLTPLLEAMRAGKTIVLWPDNDRPGIDAMSYLRMRLEDSKVVRLPHELPDKWDLADPVPAGISLQGLLDATLNPPPPASTLAPVPYVPLGIDERGYSFLSRKEGYVLHYTPGEMTELGLFRLAPDTHWLDLGLYADRGVDWKKVAKYLMEESQNVGPFDSRKLRGRGVHIDDGRIVFHAGDRLYVDGVETRTVDFRSDFLYPHRPAIRTVDMANPLPCSESQKLSELVGLFSWQHPRDALLYAGWLFLAFTPAALDWRPHGFNQGEAGSGKSWSLEHVSSPLLGDFARRFLGGASTEAGIRQALSVDCLSVILEEFDAEDPRARDNLRSQYVLARQSSSNSGCIGVKGTQEGVARSYHIKSSFLFHGTASGIVMRADRSRVAIMELVSRGSGFDDVFARIKALCKATTEDRQWSARFAARAIRLVNQTRRAISIVSEAVSRRLRDSRAADQYGSLLAGAWMVDNDEPPTPEQAHALVLSIDWTDVAPEETDTDHHACLNHLLASVVDYEDGIRHTTPVGDLIRTATSTSLPDEQTSPARKALLRHGIKVTPLGEEILIANRHAMLARVFAGSPYADKWTIHLRRLPRAGNCDNQTVAFGTVRSKAVSLPTETLTP